MEEYYKYSDQLLANLFQIIGKFTSDISKNTSTFTSETDQIRLGGPWGGGLPPH